MIALIPLLRRHWLIAALLVSAAMLAIAHAFQTFGGLQPCTLCLRQREVYWTAAAVAAIGAALNLTGSGKRVRPVFCAALALIFFAGAAVAAYHAGAEWKWWPGPTTCSAAGGGVSAASLANLMHGAKIAAPRCDEAPWHLLGLSMAGWNALASLIFAGLSLWAALEERPK